eukprot:7831801-Alexandrium_andersonii.AAC.1
MQHEWTPHGTPMPWLLMLVLYEVSTGMHVLQRGIVYPSDAFVEVTIQAVLQAFRLAFNGVLKSDMHPDDRLRFVAGYSGQHGLNTIGIAGAMGHC